jgi:hypothetical protein
MRNTKTAIVLHLLEERLKLPSVLDVRCHDLLEADIAAVGKASQRLLVKTYSSDGIVRYNAWTATLDKSYPRSAPTVEVFLLQPPSHTLTCYQDETSFASRQAHSERTYHY